MGSRPRPGPNDAGTSQGLGRPAHRGSHSRPVRLIPPKKALCRTDRGIASQKEATLRINARFSTSRCVYSCEGAFVFSSFHFSHSRVNLSLFRRRIQKKQSGITQNPICKCGSPDMLTTSILTDFVGGSRTSFHRMVYILPSAPRRLQRMASSLDYPQEIETPCQMTARRDSAISRENHSASA